MIMPRPSYARILAAEFLGTMFLLATVIGSGIMAERLADGNLAVALLGNTIPTGCLLYTSPSPRDQRGARMPSSA